MDNRNGVWGWVVGIVVIVLIILGIWWWALAGPMGSNQTASSTPEAVTGTVSVQTRSASTVGAVVASIPNASRFAALFASTGVAGSLTNKGPYTIFVPSNAAMGATNLSGYSSMQLKRLVQYHVVVGKKLDLDAVSSGTYVALSKDPLNFNVQPQTGVAYINSSYTLSEYKASNGIVYVISAVLVPPQTANPTTGATGSPIPHY